MLGREGIEHGHRSGRDPHGEVYNAVVIPELLSHPPDQNRPNE